MPSTRFTYLDASAIVKLVIEEPESAALRAHLKRRMPCVSSALVRTEVGRAVMDEGELGARRASVQLARLDLVKITDEILDLAVTLPPPLLRSLDAIHLATAKRLGAGLRHVITYDTRMAEAATGVGLRVVAPS